MEIRITSTVAGAAYRQYFPQPIKCPFFAATEIPTTFAEAPIGVPQPPISVPIESAHARTERSMPPACARLRITGIIVAANGILSTNALASAYSHSTIATTHFTLFPLTASMIPAKEFRTPVCSMPPTTTKRPMKNSSVL